MALQQKNKQIVLWQSSCQTLRYIVIVFKCLRVSCSCCFELLCSPNVGGFWSKWTQIGTKNTDFKTNFITQNIQDNPRFIHFNQYKTWISIVRPSMINIRSLMYHMSNWNCLRNPGHPSQNDHHNLKRNIVKANKISNKIDNKFDNNKNGNEDTCSVSKRLGSPGTQCAEHVFIFETLYKLQLFGQESWKLFQKMMEMTPACSEVSGISQFVPTFVEIANIFLLQMIHREFGILYSNVLNFLCKWFSK